MKDPTKLARRTGVSSEQLPRVLCQAAEPPAEPAVQPTEGQQSAGAGMQDSNPSMPARSTTAEELDLEAFDDGEFYAQLLKEFLDSSSGAGNLSASGLYPQVSTFLQFYSHALVPSCVLGHVCLYRNISQATTASCE